MKTVSLAKVENEFNQMYYILEFRFNEALINSDRQSAYCYLRSILDNISLRCNITDECFTELLVKYYEPLKDNMDLKFKRGE